MSEPLNYKKVLSSDTELHFNRSRKLKSCKVYHKYRKITDMEMIISALHWWDVNFPSKLDK